MTNIIKRKSSSYTKFHLISIVIILSLWNIFFIIKLISSISQHTKNLILPYTAILSISSILLYGINIAYNLSIVIKHLQEKEKLPKKSLAPFIGIIGEGVSLLGINIISTIGILIFPFNNYMRIASSIFSMLSSVFIIEYASIFLNTNIKQYKKLKNANKPTKYTVWSMANWVGALMISIANISFISTSYLVKHDSSDIFKIVLFSVYISIIISLLFLKNAQEKDTLTSSITEIKPTQLNEKVEQQYLLQT
ncbi:Uncharacterized protein ehr_00836 [Ehrlichia minasensis]|nr:Uncharacterized protein ehr_00836 [Ehrlichia minasensis]